MDRGPTKFTSDVSLPKDDKIAIQGEQITTGQLTGLKTHRNANYATRKEEAQKHGQYAKTSRPKSICIYSLIIDLEIFIQKISLVLSCEPHPKCKPKATDNCIKRTLRKVTNPCTREYKHRCFLPGGSSTSPRLMFLSLKLVIRGLNPQSSITLPLGVPIYYLDKVIKSNGEHARITQEQKYKRRRTKYINHINVNIIS